MAVKSAWHSFLCNNVKYIINIIQLLTSMKLTWGFINLKKVIFTKAGGLGEYHFWVDKFLCQPLALVNITRKFQLINPHVNFIEVNNCIISVCTQLSLKLKMSQGMTKPTKWICPVWLVFAVYTGHFVVLQHLPLLMNQLTKFYCLLF